MMELPEILTISKQANEKLTGKYITHVFPPTNFHKFTFFAGDPESYKQLLTGKKILSVHGAGIFLDIRMEDGITLTLGDGVNMKYGNISDKIPEKYQLLLTFNDETFLVLTVAMYGGIYAYKGFFDNKYHIQSQEKISPLSNDFDDKYFNELIENEKKNISAKALLASEQRIPGIGNGALQDILFQAGINPKRKINSLSSGEKKKLFHTMKETLNNMTQAGGRDTETDFFGNKGGYKTLLSSKTYKFPCPVCGGSIIKEAYMGGSIYYCPNCQPL